MPGPRPYPDEVYLVQTEVRDNGHQLLLSEKLHLGGVHAGASGPPDSPPPPASQRPQGGAVTAAFPPPRGARPLGRKNPLLAYSNAALFARRREAGSEAATSPWIGELERG